tara:strand:+ start:25 stop:438 length:414 start_codon:yes stop_codon:yes gene_type:complete
MKISKKKLQKIIKEELEMAEKGPEMGYSGPKIGSKIDDLEGEMVKDQLCHIAQYAIAMAGALEDDQELEGWVQSKITLAKDYVSKVRHHLETELQVEMPAPSKEEIYKLIEKDEENEEKIEAERSSYAGQGKFYYDV